MKVHLESTSDKMTGHNIYPSTSRQYFPQCLKAETHLNEERVSSIDRLPANYVLVAGHESSQCVSAS
jgi:hypothetical protein